jgi:uncharacterized protein (TIGR03000 family)
MRKLLGTLATAAILVSAALLGPGPVWGQHGGGHGGGHSGGGGHAGGGRASGGHAGGGFSSGARPSGFSAGVHPGTTHFGATHVGGVGAYNHAYRNNYGSYRPYNGGYGRNYGGYGYGGYRPYYAYGGYLPYAFGSYLPYYSNYYSPFDYGAAFASYSPYDGGLGASAYSLVAGYGSANVPPVSDAQAASPSPADQPPPDNLAHFQLTVPENAEVLIDGTRTTQTGSVREFMTPALTPGSRYSYKVTVRYSDAQGKVVEDARDIRFQANDWFAIDFTRPPPAQQAPAPAASPLPRAIRDQ